MNQEDLDLRNQIDAVWDLYTLTQHPNALASYIELGGEIDDEVRAAIVVRLQEGLPKQTGKRNNIRDIKVYMEIKSIHFGFPFDGHKQKGNEDSGPTKTLKKAREIYIKRNGTAAEDDAIRKQYVRGRKILEGK
jgi:hypothetical protein